MIGSLALKFQGSADLRTFLATGILGGFTTFSAFSLDFAFLMQRHEQMQAALYVVELRLRSPSWRSTPGCR